ncbi:hypothetical protein [Streptomyces canus]|uniref:hypothetical protein n=1 Tax=Streptomyces canus TaxID=58343 RepID=UPI0030E0159E
MSITPEAPSRAPARITQGAREQQQAPTTAASAEGSLELLPRFLNFLIPAVTAAVGQYAPTLAPQIGSAIGGLVSGSQGSKAGGQIGGQVGGLLGSLFGARELDGAVADVEISRALQEFQLTQVVTQIVQDSTPAIITALQQEVQQRAARGETGDVDDETMERGWGILASVITEQVIKHAPAAIKLATKALGSVVGSRDVDAYTPLLVDTETTQRFVLPSIATILSGVQTCLPQLFSLVAANREIPRDTGISWQDLETTKRLWDNDNIAVVSLDPIDNANEIEIVLELAPHKTWWKGIQVQDDNGSLIAEIGVQDRNKVASIRVAAQQLLSPGGYLVFSKAKFLGIHTPMYRLATGGLNQLRGRRVTFYWYAD